MKEIIDEIEEPVFPDYENSILNLSNSILLHFGVKPEHHTLASVDEILSHNYKHVVVILLDGLGMNILEKHLTYKDFLRRHLLSDYSSVFPPTTTASTTTFLSGKSPIEHGWLGWDVYFEQEDKTVTCFFNTLQDSDKQAADYNIPEKYIPYENIIEKINKAEVGKAYSVFPFGDEPHPQMSDWLDTIRKHCHKDEKNFVYAYWENPDHELHFKGTNSNDVAKIVQDLNAKMTYICEECPETVFFITADHGHTDIRNETLVEDHPEISKMLIRQTSIEPRAISFYVKPEFMDKFPEAFKKEFGKDYILFSKAEALEKQLFGPGFPNSNLTGIGDFIAAAYKEKTLVWNKNSKQFKSHHAGLSKNELSIPLIWYESKPKRIGLIIYYALIALFVTFLFIAII